MVSIYDVIEMSTHSTSTLTMHNTQHHVTFTEDIGDIQVAGMRTTMNNAVHVEIEMIKLGQESIVRDNLVDFRVAFRNPSVELCD